MNFKAELNPYESPFEGSSQWFSFNEYFKLHTMKKIQNLEGLDV